MQDGNRESFKFIATLLAYVRKPCKDSSPSDYLESEYVKFIMVFLCPLDAFCNDAG